MKTIILSIFTITYSVIAVYSQSPCQFFPTGMKWQEVLIEPDTYTYEETRRNYEIGNDVYLNGKMYKEVKVDGKETGLYVREYESEVWVHVPDYPEEIKIYDFSVEQNKTVFTDYLKGDEGTLELCHYKQNGSYATVIDSDKTYYYQMEFDHTLILGIGRISELNRNSALLGYKEPSVVLPGLLYWKVMWIERNSDIIFKSENSHDWIMEIPNSIKKLTNKTYDITYSLSGILLYHEPKRGIYIKNGKKVIK